MEMNVLCVLEFSAAIYRFQCTNFKTGKITKAFPANTWLTHVQDLFHAPKNQSECKTIFIRTCCYCGRFAGIKMKAGNFRYCNQKECNTEIGLLPF